VLNLQRTRSSCDRGRRHRLSSATRLLSFSAFVSDSRPAPAKSNAVTRDRRVVIGPVLTRAVKLIAVERTVAINTKGSEIHSTGRDGGRSGL
jgi:hypothetical protein